jgi:hypothetical protein
LLDADKSNTTADESSFCDEQNDSVSSAEPSSIQTKSPRNPYRATSGTLLTTEARRTVLSVIRGLNRENEKLPKKDRLSQSKINQKAAYLLGVKVTFFSVWSLLNQ